MSEQEIAPDITQGSELQAIRNQIIFNFMEDTTRGQFNSKSAGGILMVEHGHNQIDNERWARALAVGPDVGDDFAVGDLILIENLRWTSEFIVNEESYWITTDTEILAKWDDEENLPSELV